MVGVLLPALSTNSNCILTPFLAAPRACFKNGQTTVVSCRPWVAQGPVHSVPCQLLVGVRKLIAVRRRTCASPLSATKPPLSGGPLPAAANDTAWFPMPPRPTRRSCSGLHNFHESTDPSSPWHSTKLHANMLRQSQGMSLPRARSPFVVRHAGHRAWSGLSPVRVNALTQ